MVEIVAEISGNHGGVLENAFRLIHEAKGAGADAVKFQCFEPERLAIKRAITIGPHYEGRALIDLYRQTHTPKPWFSHLIHEANSIGLPWFSSVFDPDDVAFLETLACPRYKISAFEMLDGSLINAVVVTGKPIVMSVRPRPGLTILQATEYVTRPGEPPLGVSDHSESFIPSLFHPQCPMVERHIRLPDVETPDSGFSSTPEEFAAYVKSIREAS